MLSLDRQNDYRTRYKRLRPGWQTSGELYERMVRHATTPTTQLLDIGCGAGGVVELLSREVALAVGTDIDLPSLRAHRDPRVRLTASTLAHLPFPAESFDLVLCSWVFEHLTTPHEALAEIARVLKPGGHFAFITPNAHNLVTRINRLIPVLLQGRLVRWLYGREEQDTFPVAYRLNTIHDIHQQFGRVALDPIEIRLVNDPTYLAFNTPLFYASALLEALTPAPYAVHIVGAAIKRPSPRVISKSAL